MQRYFVDNAHFFENHAYIQGQDYHHIKNVMRMRPGDEIVVLNSSGIGYESVITEISDSVVFVDFKKRLAMNPQNSSITIAQAIIKRDRFEWLLEKATEMGVAAILPTAFERSIVKIDEESENKKIQRYQAIVKEAAEQSRRFDIPRILSVSKLAQIAYGDYDKILICYEGASAADHLSNIAHDLSQDMKILVIVGPEGGISPSEMTILEEKGGIVCSLGKRILRSESAGLMVLAYLNTLWEC
jgi:16S rRNA (uracil1498-N3)-methyltransferase